MNKTFSLVLAIALIVAIVYSIVVTRDRDALNTELESVEAVLTSTQAELSSTKQGLTLIQTELSATKQTLISVQNELVATKKQLQDVEARLKFYNETLGVEVFSGIQPQKYTKPGSSPINLINNPNAANSTWQELKAFLFADPTDDNAYRENFFNCTNFAEMLHNNAEAAGIKAAFVAVFFEDREKGHALNAFKTTDKGLVYVDCTGKGLFQGRTSEEWDKIAYLVKAKELGSISLGSNTPLDYSSYEKMKADWDTYDGKLEAYNQEVAEYNLGYSEYQRQVSKWGGADAPILEALFFIERLLKPGGTSETFKTFAEWRRYLEEQGRVLDNLRAQLEQVWEPLSIVSNFEIYW